MWQNRPKWDKIWQNEANRGKMGQRQNGVECGKMR